VLKGERHTPRRPPCQPIRLRTPGRSHLDGHYRHHVAPRAGAWMETSGRRRRSGRCRPRRSLASPFFGAWTLSARPCQILRCYSSVLRHLLTEPAPGHRRPRRRLGRVGANRLGENGSTPPSEPCGRLSTHTALRSAERPAGMEGNMAPVAQDHGLALPARSLPGREWAVHHVLQPADMMHLE